MKLDTFLLLTTVHSHSFTPSTLSGTLTCKSPLTLHWQPSRQWSFTSFREKWERSESSISPPPSTTCSLHCPQLAFPPQADGKKMPFSLRVAITLLPWSTVSSLSPLTVIRTLPLGERYFLATSRITTSSKMMSRKTTMLININCPIYPYLIDLSPRNTSWP